MTKEMRIVACIVAVACGTGCTGSRSSRNYGPSENAGRTTIGTSLHLDIDMHTAGMGVASCLSYGGQLVSPGREYFLVPALEEPAQPKLSDDGQYNIFSIQFSIRSNATASDATALDGSRVRIRTVWLKFTDQEITVESTVTNSRTGVPTGDVLVHSIDGRLMTDPVMIFIPKGQVPLNGLLFCIVTDLSDGFAKPPAPRSNVAVAKLRL